MGRSVKITKERCLTCKYCKNISSSYVNGSSMPYVNKFCDYMNIEKESRVFKNGDYREDYEPGYCQVYKRKEIKNA